MVKKNKGQELWKTAIQVIPGGNGCYPKDQIVMQKIYGQITSLRPKGA